MVPDSGGERLTSYICGEGSVRGWIPEIPEMFYRAREKWRPCVRRDGFIAVEFHTGAAHTNT